MPRFRSSLAAALLLAVLALTGTPLAAGLQNFVLVNQTGFTIYELYFSESNNNDWEEDMLGEDVLLDGESYKARIQGSDQCYWDIMAVDEYDDAAYWTEIDLCSVSTIYLYCNGEGTCWAEFE